MTSSAAEEQKPSLFTNVRRTGFRPFNFFEYSRPFLEPGERDFNKRVPKWFLTILDAMRNFDVVGEQQQLPQAGGNTGDQQQGEGSSPPLKKPKKTAAVDDAADECLNRLLANFSESCPVGIPLGDEIRVALDEVGAEQRFERNATALNRLGQFAERRECPLSAHSFFRRAISLQPADGELAKSESYAALCRRVDSLDSELFSSAQDRQIEMCDTFNDPSSPKQVRRFALRDAFYRHIFNTCRIEDVPITFEQVYDLLREGKFVDLAKKENGGKEEEAALPPLFDFYDNEASKLARERAAVIAAAKAFSMMLERVHNNEPIDIEFIINLNETLLDGVTDQPGEFIRTLKVTPPMVQEELEKMIKWMEEEMAKQLIDPITLATLVHYYMVDIHGFVDGNGRIARLLMNYVLLKCGFPPVIIPADVQKQYFYLINLASLDDHRPFIRFVAGQLKDTLDQLLNFVEPIEGRSAESTAQSSASSSLSTIEKPRADCLNFSRRKLISSNSSSYEDAFAQLNNSSPSFFSAGGTSVPPKSGGGGGCSASSADGSIFSSASTGPDWSTLFIESLLFDQ